MYLCNRIPLCLYVRCLYTFIYTYMCVCMYTCLYAQITMSIYIHIYIYIDIHIYMHVYVCAYVRSNLQIQAVRSCFPLSGSMAVFLCMRRVSRTLVVTGFYMVSNLTPNALSLRCFNIPTRVPQGHFGTAKGLLRDPIEGFRSQMHGCPRPWEDLSFRDLEPRPKRAQLTSTIRCH